MSQDESPSPNTTRVLGRFVALFIVLCLIFFYAIGATPWVQNTFFPRYLVVNAEVSAWLLDLLGEQARTTDNTIITSRFAIEIRRGCDAIAPSALFAAAVLAFPAGWRRKITGLLVGVTTLLLLNLVRIISLYYTGVYFPDAFETMHLDVWQPLFIVLALLLWLVWALRGGRPRAPTTPPETPEPSK